MTNFLFFQVTGIGVLDNILSPIIAFVPKVFGAIILLFVAWIIASIVRWLIGKALFAGKVDTYLATEQNPNSGRDLVKTLATGGFWLIFLLFMPGILGSLGLESVSQPITNMLDMFFAAIPKLIGAGIILAVAYFIGGIISSLVAGLLEGIGFNRVPAAIGIKQIPTEGKNSASSIVGTLLFVITMFFAVLQAVEVLQFPLLANIVQQLLVFGGQLISGLVIFGIGLYVAQLAAKFIKESSVANSETLATVARVAILVFVGAMALRRMGLADDIVNLAFGLTLGTVAVAAAIAFGMGGKDFAARMLNRYVEPKD